MEQKVAKAGRPRGFDEAEARRAILRTFWSRGFAATSLDDLSTATGLHKPSLYGAFGNKQAMFEDSFKAYLRDVGEAMSAALAKPRLKDALAAHFTAMTTIITENDTARGCFMSAVAVPLATSDEAAATRTRRALTALEGAFRDRLTQGQGDGELSPAFDPHTGADLLMGTHLRLSMLARVGETPETIEPMWRRAVDLVTSGSARR